VYLFKDNKISLEEEERSKGRCDNVMVLHAGGNWFRLVSIVFSFLIINQIKIYLDCESIKIENKK